MRREYAARRADKPGFLESSKRSRINAYGRTAKNSDCCKHNAAKIRPKHGPTSNRLNGFQIEIALRRSSNSSGNFAKIILNNQAAARAAAA
jgi:hypothetical protein